jgi:hypothetical protein
MIARKKADGRTEQVRPTFLFYEREGYGSAEATAQITEGIRNNLEDLNRKQMLQWDVRRDIAAMRIALEKIARYLAPLPKRRGKKRKS